MRSVYFLPNIINKVKYHCCESVANCGKIIQMGNLYAEYPDVTAVISHYKEHFVATPIVVMYPISKFEALSCKPFRARHVDHSPGQFLQF